jgi:hypothetical protein
MLIHLRGERGVGMNGRYFQIFMGICLITMMYGFDSLKQSQTNQTSGNIVSNGYEDALKVNTEKSHAVLGVVTRVMQSAAKIGDAKIDRSILNNLVQAALDDKTIDASAMVNVDYLASRIDTNSKPNHAMASDAEIFLEE